MHARRLLVAALVLLPARLWAQPAAGGGRAWISIDAGTQTGTKGFSDAVEVPLYQENKKIATTYPRGGGVLVSGAGGVTIWKRLSVGLGVSHASRGADAQVTAALPHPFFDNQPRTVDGTARATRDETGAHVKIAWTAALSPTLRLIVAAGPSVISLRQTLVTDVNFSESYPYDTAAFTSAATTTASKSAPGGNASADVVWLLSRHVGAGGAIQFSRAHVKLTSGSRTIGIDAGGVQIGGGLRLVF